MNTPGDVQLVDYARSLDCIHCGLCLQTCPTYRLTGVETSSPRGRIHLMRAVAEGRAAADGAYADELDFCLLCRHCESVCPAGVEFGQMMEIARARREQVLPRAAWVRFARWLGFRVVLPSRLALRLAGSLLRLVRLFGLHRLGGPLAAVPRVPPGRARRLLPEVAAPDGERRARVVLLQGCVMPETHARANHAASNVLRRLGAEVCAPVGVVCCGSLHAHNGDTEGARALVLRLADELDSIEDVDGTPAPLVVPSAGCGSHLKDCAELFEPESDERARAERLAARVVDFAEWVAPRADGLELELAPQQLRGPVAWDDPCHLCHGQGVRSEPRELLARIKGLERVELPDAESCCGSAGLYALARPTDSNAVFEGKLEAWRECGARTLVTANPGCQMQWETGLRRAGERAGVVHLAELLDAASLESERRE